MSTKGCPCLKLHGGICAEGVTVGRLQDEALERAAEAVTKFDPSVTTTELEALIDAIRALKRNLTYKSSGVWPGADGRG